MKGEKDLGWYKVSLARLNIAVCSLHFALALWMLIAKFHLKQDWEIPVATTFLSWNQINSEKGCDGEDAGNCYVSHEIIVFDNLARISLSGLVIAFHILSFSWQLATTVSERAQQYYMSEIEKGQNILRWVEYALSAPLMMIVIGVLLGVVDVVVLSLLAVCTSVLMVFGYLQETVCLKLRNPRGKSTLVPHAAGWLLFLSYWSAVTFVFWLSLSRGSVKAPPEILGVIFSVYFLMLFLFGSFGIVQSYQVWQESQTEKMRFLAFKVEMAYLVLSLVSKGTLGVLLFWAISVRDRTLTFA